MTRSGEDVGRRRRMRPKGIRTKLGQTGSEKRRRVSDRLLVVCRNACAAVTVLSLTLGCLIPAPGAYADGYSGSSVDTSYSDENLSATEAGVDGAAAESDSQLDEETTAGSASDDDAAASAEGESEAEGDASNDEATGTVSGEDADSTDSESNSNAAAGSATDSRSDSASSSSQSLSGGSDQEEKNIVVDRSQATEQANESASSERSHTSAALDADVSIDRIEIGYRLVLYPDDEGYDPDGGISEYDPESDEQPTISKTNGQMELFATIHWSDGTVQDASEADAGITWRIVETTSLDGSTTLDAMIATVEDQDDSSGLLTALGAGDGIVKIRCSSTAYTDHDGAEILVRIENNSVSEGIEAIAAALLYDDDSTDGFVYYVSGVSRPAITVEYGRLALSIAVLMSDGSYLFTYSDGIDAQWRVTATYDYKGSVTATELAKVSSDGTVTATGSGNGSIVVEGQAFGFTVSCRVYIEGNDISGTQTATPLTLMMNYTDRTHASEVSYSTSNLPEIVDQMGNVQFVAKIYWSDGTMTNAADSPLTLTWERLYCTDFDGNEVDVPLAYISSDGLVTASSYGNGIACFRATLNKTDGSTLTYDVKVEIYGNETYVTRVSITDSLGLLESNVAIDVSVSGDIHYFTATVTFSNGSMVSSDYDAYGLLDTLEWRTLRGPSSDEDYLYSSITEDGEFSTKSGFSQCYVRATMVGGGIYGNDVYAQVRVYDGSEDENIGYSGSITVNVITRTDYDTFGLNATPSRVVTISDSDIEAAGTYTDWFTYLTRGDSWGTIYARGISIGNFVRLAGIDPSSMQFITFVGSDGYGTESGFYSASQIQSSRYRYTNYYMHEVSSSAAYLGQENVSSMIALEYYRDVGDDYISSGYSQMSSDSCLRLLMGMQGVDTHNAASMVRCVSECTIIVDDPLDDELDDSPISTPESGSTPGGSGTGSWGTGTGSSGGSGSGSGVATSGTGEGVGEGAWGTSGDGGLSGVVSLLSEVDEESVEGDFDLVRVVDNPWRSIALIAALATVVLAIIYVKRKFDDEVVIGRMMST